MDSRELADLILRMGKQRPIYIHDILFESGAPYARIAAMLRGMIRKGLLDKTEIRLLDGRFIYATREE